MKTKMLIVPIIVLLSFTISGCYTSRHYDPYYHNRENRYHHRHDRDRDGDRDRDDRYDRNYDHNRDYNYHRHDDDDR